MKLIERGMDGIPNGAGILCEVWREILKNERDDFLSRWEHLRTFKNCLLLFCLDAYAGCYFMFLCVVFCLILCVVPDPHHHRDNTSNNLWSIEFQTNHTLDASTVFLLTFFFCIITFANETLSAVLSVLQPPLYTTCETSILDVPLFLSPTFSWSVNSSGAREIPSHFHEFHSRPVRLHTQSIWITQGAVKVTLWAISIFNNKNNLRDMHSTSISQFHPHHHQQLICILLHLHDSILPFPPFLDLHAAYITNGMRDDDEVYPLFSAASLSLCRQKILMQYSFVLATTTREREQQRAMKAHSLIPPFIFLFHYYSHHHHMHNTQSRAWKCCTARRKECEEGTFFNCKQRHLVERFLLCAKKGKSFSRN